MEKIHKSKIENHKCHCGADATMNNNGNLICDLCFEQLHRLDKLKHPLQIRQFETGATRDTDINKLDYEGFLSPLVLKRYAEYLNKHRVQSDGKLRDSDNWQKMFGEKHFDVCMKSACRHFMDWWLQHRNIKTENDLEESICAVIFNAMAYLYKIEIDKLNGVEK